MPVTQSGIAKYETFKNKCIYCVGEDVVDIDPGMKKLIHLTLNIT